MVRGLRKLQGFTLLEVLVTMTLLMAFGYLVFQVLRSSLDIWRLGEARRDVGEKAAAILDLLQSDLNALYPGSATRLIAEVIAQQHMQNQQTFTSVEQRLQFVRTLYPAALAEVTYGTQYDSAANDPALQILYRTEQGSSQEVSQIAQQVLFFGMVFYGPTGTLNCWDSTRGYLQKQDAMAWNDFPFAIGPESLQDSRDDIFPAAVEVIVVLENADSRAPLAKLRMPLSITDMELEIDRAQFLPSDLPALIKIDGEWLAIESVSANMAQIQHRGLRATKAEMHKAGASVHVGTTFRAVMNLDHYRRRQLNRGMQN